MTPTGAAIIATLAKPGAALPPMHVDAIGYGAGTRTLADRPNLLRLLAGSAAASAGSDELIEIATNIDDSSPELYEHVMEQLFAAGYAACFLGAVKLVARTRKVPLTDDAAVTAKVGMGPIPTGYALAVELQVSLPGVERALAQEIVEGAHQRCPYSNATRGNVPVVLTVV